MEGGSVIFGRGILCCVLEFWFGKVFFLVFYIVLLMGYFIFGFNVIGLSYGCYILLFGVFVYSIVFKIYFLFIR